MHSNGDHEKLQMKGDFESKEYVITYSEGFNELSQNRGRTVGPNDPFEPPCKAISSVRGERWDPLRGSVAKALFC